MPSSFRLSLDDIHPSPLRSESTQSSSRRLPLIRASHTVSFSSAPTGLRFLLFLPSRERERETRVEYSPNLFVRTSVGFESCLGVDAREKARIFESDERGGEGEVRVLRGEEK